VPRPARTAIDLKLTMRSWSIAVHSNAGRPSSDGPRRAGDEGFDSTTAILRRFLLIETQGARASSAAKLCRPRR